MSPSQVRRALEKNAAERARLERELDANIRERLLLDQIARLHSGNSSNIVSGMETDHRLAISKGRSGTADKKFTDALAKAGYSITSLAEKLKVDKSTLSRYRSGIRETPRDVADRVAQLIDWPADSKHWPNLASS